jgi:hypothetical protein
MKRLTVIVGLSSLVMLALMLSSCEGPEGPPGPQGATTVINLEGFAENIQCSSCHNPDIDTTYFLWARRYQWEQSKHAIGGDIERNGPSCAGCHTTEGFIQRMQGKTVTGQPNPSPPGCFACHSPHSRGNFTLRNAAPVTIMSNIAGVSDAVFDYGKGNQCVQCHQTRSMTPLMNGSASGDSLVITTSRWYSHYGVQGQMLMGDGGFKFPGYAYTGNSIHTTLAAVKQEGCVICHMATQVYPPGMGTGKAGGHTMKLSYVDGSSERQLLSGCQTSGCHASISSLDYKGVQTAVHANLDTLKTLLIQRGWVEGNTSSSSYGLVKLTGGRLVVKPAVKAGAIYNFFFVEHDLSEGVHNPKYALELLRSSIEELRKP